MDSLTNNTNNSSKCDDPIVQDVILETSNINKSTNCDRSDDPIVIDSQNFDLGINNMETPCVIETIVEVTTTKTTTTTSQNDETATEHANKETNQSAANANETNKSSGENDDDVLLVSNENTCSESQSQQQQQDPKSQPTEQRDEQIEEEPIEIEDSSNKNDKPSADDTNNTNPNSYTYSPPSNSYQSIDVDDDYDGHNINIANSKIAKLLTSADPNLNKTKEPTANELESQVDLHLHLSQSTYISNNSYSIIEQQKQDEHHDYNHVIHDTQDSVEQMLANQKENQQNINEKHQDDNILNDDVNSNEANSKIIRDLEMFVDAVIIDDSCHNNSNCETNNNTTQQQQKQQQTTENAAQQTIQDKKHSEIVIRKKLSSIISSKQNVSKRNNDDDTIVEHFIIKNATKTDKKDANQASSNIQKSPEIEQIKISNERLKQKTKGRPPGKPVETTTFRVREVYIVEVVETTRRMTYHDIVDKDGNIKHTELVSKVTNEKILSNSEETRLNNSRTRLETSKSVNNVTNKPRGARKSGVVQDRVNVDDNSDIEENRNNSTTSTRSLQRKYVSPQEISRKLRASKINPSTGRRVYNKKLFAKRSSAAQTTSMRSPIEEEIRYENVPEETIVDNENYSENVDETRRSSEDNSLSITNYNDNESVLSRECVNNDRSTLNIETISLTDSNNLRHSTSSHSLNDSNIVRRTKKSTNLRGQLKECTVVLDKLDIDFNKMPIKLSGTGSYPRRDEVNLIMEDSASTVRSRRTSVIELSDSGENDDPNSSFNIFETRFRVGDHVFARRSDNQYYAAAIKNIHNKNRDFTVQFLQDDSTSILKDKDLVKFYDLKLDHQLMVKNKQTGQYENCTLVKIDSYNEDFEVKLLNNRVINANIVKIMVPCETANLINKRKNTAISSENVIDGKRKRTTSIPFNVSNEKKRKTRSSIDANHKSMSKSNSKSSIRSE